jgi:glycine/D-amino acid oxidase-like deaminating enzyme
VSGQDTTAGVDPFLFTRKIFQQARAKGLKYMRGEVVKLQDGIAIVKKTVTWDEERDEVADNDDQADGTETSLPCDDLVICAGPWSPSVVKK